MPPDKHKLTDEERRKADQWLKSHRKDSFSCPVCGQTNFQLQTTLGIVPLFGGGATVLGSGYPVVVMVCGNCAHMLFFNAIIAGLVPAEEEDTSDAK